MNPTTLIAAMLVGLGLVVLAYSGISFTTPGQPGNFLGMLKQTTETHFIPPVVGALVLVGGIALLVMNPRRAT
jgi:mannitol-specific phosphotransferase system IIBC component